VKRRVLIAREPQRAVTLAQELNAHGIEAICLPVTRSVPLEHPAELSELEKFSWIAFTSAHGVAAFAAWLKRSKRKIPDSAKLAAVGSGTAESLRGLLGEPSLIPTQATGKHLAEELVQISNDRSPQTVLWPCARKRTHEFEATLARAGISVVAWECYETVAVEPNTLHEQLKNCMPWDAVLLAAPSAVRSFADAWPLPWDFSAIAIGETTASALLELGGENPTVCAEASDKGMLDAILAALLDVKKTR